MIDSNQFKKHFDILGVPFGQALFVIFILLKKSSLNTRVLLLAFFSREKLLEKNLKQVALSLTKLN